MELNISTSRQYVNTAFSDTDKTSKTIINDEYEKEKVVSRLKTDKTNNNNYNRKIDQAEKKEEINSQHSTDDVNPINENNMGDSIDRDYDISCFANISKSDNSLSTSKLSPVLLPPRSTIRSMTLIPGVSSRMKHNDYDDNKDYDEEDNELDDLLAVVGELPLSTHTQKQLLISKQIKEQYHDDNDEEETLYNDQYDRFTLDVDTIDDSFNRTMITTGKQKEKAEEEEEEMRDNQSLSESEFDSYGSEFTISDQSERERNKDKDKESLKHGKLRNPSISSQHKPIRRYTTTFGNTVKRERETKSNPYMSKNDNISQLLATTPTPTTISNHFFVKGSTALQKPKQSTIKSNYYNNEISQVKNTSPTYNRNDFKTSSLISSNQANIKEQTHLKLSYSKEKRNKSYSKPFQLLDISDSLSTGNEINQFPGETNKNSGQSKKVSNYHSVIKSDLHQASTINITPSSEQDNDQNRSKYKGRKNPVANSNWIMKNSARNSTSLSTTISTSNIGGQQQQRSNKFQHQIQPTLTTTPIIELDQTFNAHSTAIYDIDSIRSDYSSSAAAASPDSATSASSPLFNSSSSMDDCDIPVDRIKSLINEFDNKFLVHDISGNEVYPDWCRPFVTEMKEKLNFVRAAATEIPAVAAQRKNISYTNPIRENHQQASYTTFLHKQYQSALEEYYPNHQQPPFLNDNKNNMYYHTCNTNNNTNNTCLNTSIKDKRLKSKTRPLSTSPHSHRITRHSIPIYPHYQDQTLINHSTSTNCSDDLVDTNNLNKLKVSRLHNAMVSQLNLVSSSLASAWDRLSITEKGEKFDKSMFDNCAAEIKQHQEDQMRAVIDKMKEIMNDQDLHKFNMDQLIEEYQLFRSNHQQISNNQSDQLIRLQTENNKLQSSLLELEDKDKNNYQLRSTIDELKHQIESLKIEKEDIRSELLKSKQLIESLQYQVVDKETELNVINHSNEERRRKDLILINNYESDVEKSTASMISLEELLNKSKEETKRNLKEKEKYQNKLRFLQQEFDQCKLEYRTKIEELLSTISELKKQKSVESNKFSQTILTIVYKILIKQFKNKLSHQITQIKELNIINNQFEEKFNQLKSSSSQEIEMLKRDCFNLQSILDSTLSTQQSSTDELNRALISLNDRANNSSVECDQLTESLRLTDEANIRLSNELEWNRNLSNNEFQIFSTFLKDSFRGDYLSLTSHPSILSYLASQGDKNIIFSDNVIRFDSLNRKQERTLILSDACLYFCSTDGKDDHSQHRYDLRRVERYSSIISISLSRHHANLLVIHFSNQYDYLIESAKRTEFMFHLIKLYKSLTNKVLLYEYGERLFVTDRDQHQRELIIEQSQKIKMGKSHILQQKGRVSHDLIKIY